MHESDKSVVLTIHDGVESDVINTWCFRTFDSTTYTHEKYRGEGAYLWLNNYPVTAIAQVAIGTQAAINIKNTAGDATSARVDVDVSAAQMTLTVTGGTSAGTDTIDLSNASYDTLSELVTAINALSDGWVAEIYHADLNSILSVELVEAKGLYCGARANTTANYAELSIPGDVISVECDEDTGELYYAGGFGTTYVTYTAGYSTMPNNLKMAVLRTVKLIYDRWLESGDGVESLKSGDGNWKYLKGLPEDIAAVYEQYRRKGI